MNVNNKYYKTKKSLPYRKGVGMMIFNNNHEIFVAKRVDTKYSAWQMPQGGIDTGETPSAAALREMKEEIGTNNANIVAESNNWYSYDLPKILIPKLWDGQYRGQMQKWFLIKFNGSDSEINIDTEHPEFCDWKWTTPEKLPKIIVPFKKKLYRAVLKEFEHIFSNT